MAGDRESVEEQCDRAFSHADNRAVGMEPTYSGALSFMRRRYSKDFRAADVDVVVSGVPFDLGTTNRPGARFGPRGVREASAQLAWGRHWPWPFDAFEHVGVIDWGDVFFESGNPQEMLGKVEAHAEAILAAGKSLLTLGGDHFVTLPLLRAHARHHGRLSLIHFDAHTDTYEESGRYDHGNMFRHAASEGLIDPERSVQIGIRTDYARENHGFTVLDADWVQNHPLQASIDTIHEKVGDNRAYLSFDIDCLDPSCAPGTGTPVVGGLTTNQALQILRSFVDVRLVGMDLVEVAPVYDVGAITALAGAHLAMDYLCVRAAQKLAGSGVAPA
ncbi:MAG: agmatinase [Myxococcales bacterium]|nr:agmatinase [Myxococcales bacterium]MDH5307040.1 agmatinase [Myxococcales bacterium]MDH5566143.1 agmatinase [Myxococcales bacterium]